ncbi:MAG: hypothetical protein DF168_00794 [Candidatus Moanabacter tarae]|uniref:Multidrug resistance protein MdtA-like barrel-sandwich hybrid domain-containing protein n=1 Tax=Candidatus Moanibacter tarae TaxID=2200854 RepID=A0A2Z4APF2_9BACT|nr:MAG: hypothetical protein DF168_00794 [Candidatus Moanabacter tarae]|tara:strand:+ start:5512 stop:6642 length:1131 start_codon:yes stop_codon:yes gene_type:complete
MPVEHEDIFTKIEDDFKRHRSSVLRLLLVGGLLCILAGVSFFQMEQRVYATGIVLRDEEFIIFSQSNGLISRIDIEEGDNVEEGDLLAILDDSDINLKLLELRHQLQILVSELAQNKLAIAEFDVRPGNGNLLNAGERLDLLNEMTEIRTEYVNSLKKLRDQNAVPQAQYAEERAQLLQLELDRSDAQLQAEWVKEGVLDIEKKSLLEEGNRLANQAVLLRKQISISENLKNRLHIRAPIGGRITELKYPYAGMTLAKGEPLLKISNSNSKYVVEAEVGERNFDLIEEGTPVRMESRVFDSILEGFIMGSVTQVDPQGRFEMYVEEAGPTFDVEIEVSYTPHPLILGSRIDVYFLIGKRSIIKTLFDIPESPRRAG